MFLHWDAWFLSTSPINVASPGEHLKNGNPLGVLSSPAKFGTPPPRKKDKGLFGGGSPGWRCPVFRILQALSAELGPCQASQTNVLGRGEPCVPWVGLPSRRNRGLFFLLLFCSDMGVVHLSGIAPPKMARVPFGFTLSEVLSEPVGKSWGSRKKLGERRGFAVHFGVRPPPIER